MKETELATTTSNQLEAHRPVLKNNTAMIRKNNRKNDPTVPNKSQITEPGFSATLARIQLRWLSVKKPINKY